MAASPDFVGTPRNITLALVNATGTTITSAYTAPAAGARIDKLMATSTDTSVGYTLQLYIQKSATNYLIGTVSVPTNSGFTSAVAAVDLLASANLALPLDPFGNKVLWLEGSAQLMVAVTVAVTAAKALAIVGLAGEY